MEIGEIIALVVAFGGALTGIITWRKTRVEAESIAVATSIELVQELRKEVKELRVELNDQRSRRQDLADELHQLQRSYKTEVTALRQRIVALEDFIRLNTEVNPETIS